MKKNKCIVCSIGRKERACMINDNKLICSVCCAKTRSPACEGCVYYARSKAYEQRKASNRSSRPFIMAIHPEAEEQVDQALAMAEKGMVDAAETKIRDLLDDYFDDAMVHYGMGVICMMKSRHDDAVSYFDSAIEINPYFVEAWYNKGAAHQMKLDVPDMIRAYKEVIHLGDPAEDCVGKARDLLTDFENSIRKESGLNLDAYLKSMEIFNSAFAAMEKAEWETALAGFKRVLASEPRHTQSYGNMGLCYAFLGRKQDAMDAFDKALELDPGYEPAIINRRNVAALKDGEKLSETKLKTVDYNKDRFKEKRSLRSRLFG